MMRIFFSLLLITLMIGCASKLPAPIKDAPPGNPALAEVRQDPQRFVGTSVRWGGVIVQVDNKKDRTLVEVVGRELRDDGEPIIGSRSDGRFIASFPIFVDPIVYSDGDYITVAGNVVGQTTRTIGEYEYVFPVVEVTASHLWQAVLQRTYYDPPPAWWYYDPWWPYYPGYYHRRFHPYW